MSIGTIENPNTGKGIETSHKDSLESDDPVISVNKPKKNKSEISRSIPKLLSDIARGKAKPNNALYVLTYIKYIDITMSEFGLEVDIEKGKKVYVDQRKVKNVDCVSDYESIIEKLASDILNKLRKWKAKFLRTLSQSSRKL